MAKSLIIMLADGLEEVEFCLPFDLCHRAGIAITLVAVPSDPDADSLSINGSHQLQLRAQISLQDFLQGYRAGQIAPDAVFLPGGMPGSKHLAQSPELVGFLREYAATLEAKQRYLAAICAAPAHVLGRACGLLRGKKYTGYPGTESIVPADLGAEKLELPLVEDERLITASGVGSAHWLAERLIERLCGAEKAKEVMQAVLYQ